MDISTAYTIQTAVSASAITALAFLVGRMRRRRDHFKNMAEILSRENDILLQDFNPDKFRQIKKADDTYNAACVDLIEQFAFQLQHGNRIVIDIEEIYGQKILQLSANHKIRST